MRELITFVLPFGAVVLLIVYLFLFNRTYSLSSVGGCKSFSKLVRHLIRDRSLPIEEGDERANVSDDRRTGVDTGCTAIFRLRTAGAWSTAIGGTTITSAYPGAPTNCPASLSWSTRLEEWPLASSPTQRSVRLVVGCRRILVLLSPTDGRAARLRLGR